ncbi:hypothetical protein CRG98_038433 [Punica granatum]|uniref:Uncharacterized protein n=1 Tax=Punica granatum TaxID=22663 RepID=A0A2I0ICQ2_PUNGR|nr:hypothetical protein CRG98_038433 [Punica granatum]
MARLSTLTRSSIGSPTELNRPRRILLQAQWAAKHVQQMWELRQTLIPDPSRYVGAPSWSSSPTSQDRGIPNKQATAPTAGPVSGKSMPHGHIPDAIVQQILNRATNGDRHQPLRPHGITPEIFTAFRTSCPVLQVHLYSFPNFVSTFTTFRTLRPWTSRPHLLLFGLRIHIYYFLDSASTNFASTFTAFNGLRPGNLPLSTGFGLAIYRFPRALAWHFTAFHGLRPGILPLSMGFGLASYRFPRSSPWHLPLSTGFGLATYRFPRASAWQFTAFHRLRLGNLPLSTGFGLTFYRFRLHFTAFHGFRPSILSLSTGFGLQFIAFHGLRPGYLPLSTGFGLAIYYFPRALA